MTSTVGIVEKQPTAEAEEKTTWLSKDWLEPRLVAVTLAALLLGIFVEQAADFPAWVAGLLGLIAYVAGGFYGTQTAIESLREKTIDVDLLMVLAALGAAVIGQWHEGALLLFLFSLSNVLQDYAINRSRTAIKSLFKLYPNEANVRRNGQTITVGLEDIRLDDEVLIKPGERIPVDGTVINGQSALDESPITGESMPVDKGVGDTVFAGTLNKQGILDIRPTKAAEETTLARIIKMVEEAQDSKAPTERFLDTFEQRYAMFIIVATILFIIIPPLLGLADFESNFYRAMVLMTVASPCALIISVPAAFISAIAAAARGGVLFKGGAYIESLASVKAIAFDKTGTLTYGQPTVTDVTSCCELCGDDLLAVAAAVEARSEHPLARAIVRYAEEQNVTVPEVEQFEAVPGQGIAAEVDGRTVHLGSLRYLETLEPAPDHLQSEYERLESMGRTVIGVLRQDNCNNCSADCELKQDSCDWMGLIAMADEVRPEAKQIIDDLHKQGVAVAMLTGDNERVAKTLAAELGIDRVHAGLMPDEKVEAVRDLQATYGQVAMVGDGVNDAPALALADIGIAMGAAGTDVALETADIVLMADRIERIEFAIDLAKKARRVVWQNITFAIAVIIMLVLGTFLIQIPLPLGVLGHEGSTVIVVLNGLIALLLLPELKRRRESANAA
ncbi:MAG: cadmium-translocating P-type ATPase [Anaerolineaceae bacterium]|nr:cadmium-translocating P-type ATPase [Anaerolineaceae bacterium]